MESPKTSNSKSTLENGTNDPFTSDLTEHRSYNLVLKMVLWGDSEEDVYQRLSVNNVPDDLAKRLYKHARADRIRTIRSNCSHTLLIGLGLLAASVAIFCGCWFGLGFIPKILLYGCIAALGIGSWKFIDGLIGYLLAPSKTGSITD